MSGAYEIYKGVGHLDFNQIFIVALAMLILQLWVLPLKICLTFDYTYSGLTMENSSSCLIIIILIVDKDRSERYNGVPPPLARLTSIAVKYLIYFYFIYLLISKTHQGITLMYKTIM